MGEFIFEPIEVNSTAPGGACVLRTFDDVGAFILMRSTSRVDYQDTGTPSGRIWSRPGSELDARRSIKLRATLSPRRVGWRTSTLAPIGRRHDSGSSASADRRALPI
jgi:hypothetical protein